MLATRPHPTTSSAAAVSNTNERVRTGTIVGVIIGVIAVILVVYVLWGRWLVRDVKIGSIVTRRHSNEYEEKQRSSERGLESGIVRDAEELPAYQKDGGDDVKHAERV